MDSSCISSKSSKRQVADVSQTTLNENFPESRTSIPVVDSCGCQCAITSDWPVIQDLGASECQHVHFDAMPTICSSGFLTRNAPDSIRRPGAFVVTDTQASSVDCFAEANRWAIRTRGFTWKILFPQS